MNDRSVLEADLIQLGEQLRREPSVVGAVTQRILQLPQVLEDRVEFADQCVPTARSMSRRVFRFSATLAAFATAVVLMLVFLRDGTVAFAQVQERLASVQTATLRFSQTVMKESQGSESMVSHVEQRILVTADGRMRIESPDGSVATANRVQSRRLTIDPKSTSATLAYDYDLVDKQDLLAELRSLHVADNAEPIAEKIIDGLSCPGFRIEEPESTLRVWVSPKSLLPILAERTIPNADGARRGSPVQVIQSYSDIRFDTPCEDSQFSVEPPDGYLLTIVGKPPAQLSEVFSETPVIVPGVGVGPLKFGMTEADVVQMLGRPDQVDIRSPDFPITDETSQVDDQARPPGASLVVLTQFRFLTYHGLGLSLNFEISEGLKGIMCREHVRIAEGVEFPGQTAAGIGIGSPAADVLTAYGRADGSRRDDLPKGVAPTELRYKDAGLSFSLTPAHTVSLISVDDRKQNRLRFEWRGGE